jgi:hypothetical protein
MGFVIHFSAMKDRGLYTRAWEAVQCLDSGADPLWKRIVTAMGVFKGVLLTGLPDGERQLLEEQMLQVNKVLTRYNLKTFEDYSQISLDDLDDIAMALRRLESDLRELGRNKAAD